MGELYPMQTQETNAVEGCNPQMAQQDTYKSGTTSHVTQVLCELVTFGALPAPL